MCARLKLHPWRSRAPSQQSLFRWLAPAIALGSSLFARPTSAEVPLATRIEYHAPPGCPQAAEFEKRLRARAPRVRLVSSGAAPRTLYVEIIRRADGMAGTLRVGDAAGGAGRRTLKAVRCEDTVDGLALVAAVALDPEGPGAPPPDETQPPQPAPPEPPAPVPTAPPQKPPEAEPPRPELVAPANPDRDAGAARPHAFSSEDDWHLLVGVGTGGLFGHAPGALPAFMFLFGTEWYVSPWWAPSLRASFVQTTERDFSETGGIVQFRATMGMGEACPFRFGPPQLGFRPCLVGAGGVATISGTQTLQAQSNARWRWYLGASGLMSLAVSKNIDVGAAAGFLIPMRQDQVAFSRDSLPSLPIFSDPVVTEYVRLDLTVAFP
ncbi:MAG TPA: hypothetical protein VGL13_05090 [Polyangiaceae bacterium]